MINLIKKIYEKNKKISLTNVSSFPNFSSRKKLIFFLKDESNDLEKAVIKIYPKVGKIIDFNLLNIIGWGARIRT